MKTKLPEQGAGQNVALRVIPIAAASAIKADVPLAVKEEEAEKQGTVIDRAEIAPRNVSGPFFLADNLLVETCIVESCNV